MTDYGVIVRTERILPALAAGADYVEPIIVGNLAVLDGTRWIRNPEFPDVPPSSSFAILVPGDIKLSDPAFDIEAIAAYFDTVLGIVHSAAAPAARIVFGSGGARTIPEGADASAARARFAQSLRIARDAARRYDLRMLLEPLNRGESNLINSLTEAAAFLDEYAIDGVTLVADLFHMMLENEPLSVLAELGPRIGHAHITDTGRTPPGQGDWPLADFIEALRGAGYEGSITIESNFTDFEPELAASLAHLRAIA